MKKYKGKLYRKLLLIYLPVLVLVLSFIALNILRQAGIEAKRNFSVRAEIIQSNFNNSLNLWLENSAGIAHLLIQGNNIASLCKQPQNPDIKKETSASFEMIYQNNKAINNICLFTNPEQNGSNNQSTENTINSTEPLVNIKKIDPEYNEYIKEQLNQTIKTKLQTISRVFYSEQNEPIVYLITPVIENNKALGAIFMQLNLNYFTSKIIGNIVRSDDETSVFLFNKKQLILIDTIHQNLKNALVVENLFGNSEKNLFYQQVEQNEYLINYQSLKIAEIAQEEDWYIAVFQSSTFINSFIRGKLSKLVPIIVLMLMLYGALIIYTTKRLVINPLNNTVEEIQKFAQGDLQTEQTEFRQDEIGFIAQQLYEAKLNLSNNIIGLLQEKSKGIELQNKVVMEIAENLVQNSNEEAAAVEEISATTEEFLSMAKQNAEVTAKNTREAQNLGASLEILTKAVKQTVDALMDISEQIVIIDEIASKTDLLAINAAIEASRSGESGKGFAVVADEIKKLAAKTGKASAQIKNISNDSKEKAAKTMKIIEMAIPKIQELVSDLRRINEAVKEQENGVIQINASILQLSSTSQNNLGRTEELSGTVNELSEIVVNLNTIVMRFKTDKSKNAQEQMNIQDQHQQTSMQKAEDSNKADAKNDLDELVLEKELSAEKPTKTYTPNTDFPTKININLKDDDFESY